MDAAAESTPVEPAEVAPGFVARNMRWIKLAAIGLAVLIPLLIAAALMLGGGKDKPAAVISPSAPTSETAAGSQAAAASAPAPAHGPTPEEAQAAAREAEQRRQAVLEAHDKVMSGDVAAGTATSVPVSIRPSLGKSVPVAAANAPEPLPAAVEKKPAEPKSTMPQPVAKAETAPAANTAPPTSAAMPTPLGRQGYGVNQSNVEGLTTLIEAMNKADAAKNKPRK